MHPLFFTSRLRVYPVIIVLLVMMVASAVSCAAAESEEMKAIVARLRMGEHGLNLAKLPLNHERTIDSLLQNKSLENYRIPLGSEVDPIVYTVYYDRANRRYWVSRIGTAMGMLNVYGPVDFPAKSH